MKQVIYLDGDNIGNHMELLLLDGKLDEAAAFSKRLTRAMLQLRDSLQQIPGAEICLFGGDDIIATFPINAISMRELNQFRAEFEILCGKSISAGVGRSVQEALANLRRAKLSGRNRLVSSLYQDG